jgi:hypothetical protein
MADVETVRRIALALPEAEEGTAYGTPAWRVRKKLFARMREDGVNLVVKTDPGEREILMSAEPEVFHITDHYAPYPAYVLVRLAAIDAGELREVLTDSWRTVAPKRLAAQLAGLPDVP